MSSLGRPSPPTLGRRREQNGGGGGTTAAANRISWRSGITRGRLEESRNTVRCLSMGSSSGEEEGTNKWVPPSQRPELADVVPVGQDDGPCPVVSISYRDDFREVMDYFRALYSAGERSPRALHFTAEAIHFNPGNYTVWHFRRLVLEALDTDLLQEMNFVDQIAESNPKNYQVWHHKRWLAEKLGPDAANSEHEFTRKMLAIDAKNYHAWSHRQWVLQALGGWESELQYCNQLLEEDVFNNSAWNQRYLVITSSPLLGGLVAMRDSEVDYTVEAIMANPRNESPWRYLKGLYKGDNYLPVADRRISDVCLKVLKDDSTCIFALSLLVDLLRMGLQPSDELKGTIESMENCDPETSHVDLATAVCSILQKCDPLRISYWSWYRTTLS
ncbi:protein farnesyltransferase/geranylgeranyltransferase type-1 subunit alpha isoform X2 [Brachypodium distachyon]|uniref:protein farnesyltransferase/geranylgeranyltransferase type-1 subunit alpha isoform X2 n=1 Tax=Brachypodium distachyon TaxID=15368 RepID=UPI00071D6880|nr:protein farnesyltransferase/geranylgeranyltransferase type-1 subunit alpha isoform X2 [Brachypodium distachyon]|eukprot:XP_014758209.1 protein farnesyltransferase/geranylgeranyltransferase type-1 subunit alpha isoform X2 [Brachypodium distachyon]